MAEKTIHPQKPEKLDRYGIKQLVSVTIYLLLELLILFIAAGRIDWTAAWVYMGLRFTVFILIGMWMARTHPEIINARGRPPKERIKSWDKVFAAVYAPLLFIAPLVAGLDAGRFGWSTMPLSLQVVGFALLIPAFTTVHFLFWREKLA
ncbi:MAG: hypothetical protein HF973_19055 [Chloroflexi bacterium]|nr:hypothetical protein [Chloroflexota bacterium]